MKLTFSLYKMSFACSLVDFNYVFTLLGLFLPSGLTRVLELIYSKQTDNINYYHIEIGLIYTRIARNIHTLSRYLHV